MNVQERLRLPQVDGIERAREGAADLGHHPARFRLAAMRAPQAADAERRAQLERFGTLLTRDRERSQ